MEKKIKTKQKKEKIKAPKIKLVSYSIKMVIPTVAYGNIQPEIIVKASSVDEAHDYIVPHMNKLWKEYYLVDGKRPDTVNEPEPIIVKVASQPPVSSVALVKATQAINSCLSLEALELITNQVYASVKLTDEDKKSLGPLLDSKHKELNEKS